MKVKNFLRILFCLGIFLVFHNIGYAGTQRLNSIDYKVQLKPDGSMEVVETWDIYMDETNTLFKDFVLDASKYGYITNVKVKDLETQKELTEIYQEMYHVTKDCYYGLPVSKDKFEIAWGVGLDDSSDTRKYQISYTVEDVISVYLDCSQLYWQFIGNTNGIKAKKVTGAIRLPQAVENLEKLRVWAHGPLNGEIYKTTNDTITFSVDNLEPETMVETRIVVEEPMFTQSLNHFYQNKLPEILAEEEKWAQEANQARRKSRVIFGIFAMLDLVLFVFFGKKIFRYKKELKKVKEEQFSIDIGKYFRDIPRENEATPAEAVFLCNLSLYGVESAVISATLLQLCLKKYLCFDKVGNEIQIHLLKPADEQLKGSEKVVYKIVTESLGSSEDNTVTMGQIKKYAKTHYDDFEEFMKELKQQAKSFHETYGNYDRKMEKNREQYDEKWNGYFSAIAMVIYGFIFYVTENGMTPLLIWTLPILLEWGICGILLRKIQKYSSVLTEQGETERQQWKGLKRYMEDFSLLKDRDIPDLVLWEKYLVYATAFGISAKVIEQLKMVYPQMQDLDRNTYVYLYLMSDNRFSGGFIQELNKSTKGVYRAYTNAYDAAHSADSSGSGGGGGFSDGGGDRWWRWPEWVEDKLRKKGKREKWMKIGMDIGGSHIGVGLVEEGRLLASLERNFRRENRKNREETILRWVPEMVNQLLKENDLTIKQIERIGIAAPGTISNGVIVSAGNLNVKSFEIVAHLQKMYTIPIQIRNDAKCAALAEKEYGAMKDYEDCVFLTIGTGIGGAAFLGGKLLEPKKSAGFEFGHMILNKGGRHCSCGKEGCFETYCSIKALKNKVTETLDVDNDISGEFLREELIAKNREAVAEDMEEFLEYLKTGIGNLIEIFEPEIVCLGGSFAYYEDHPIFNELLNKMHESNCVRHSHCENLPKIVMASLKNNAGMIGAVIE